MKTWTWSAIFVLAVGCSSGSKNGGTGGGSGGGTASGGSGSTSSAGAGGTSSAGSGSTSSAGSGSSSSAGSGSGNGFRINLINAAPLYNGAIDFCVKADGSDYVNTPVALGSGVAYAHASGFGTAPMSNGSVRVIAAGSGCGTADTELAHLDDIVFAPSGQTGLQFNVVAYNTPPATPGGDPTMGVQVFESDAPTAGQTWITLVNALSTTNPADTVDVALAIPFSPQLVGATLGSGGGTSFAPLASNVVLAGTVTSDSSYQFPTFSSAADTRLTAVLLGSEGATDSTAPALLVCDDTGSEPSCTTIANQPTALVRIANLTATTEATTFFWIGKDNTVSGNEDYTLPVDLQAGLAPATVSQYFAQPASAGAFGAPANLVAATSGTTAPTGPINAPAAGTFAGIRMSFEGGTYQTVTFGGDPTHDYGFGRVLATPFTGDDSTTLVSSAAALGDVAQPVTVTAFAAFGTVLGSGLARASDNTGGSPPARIVPASVWQSLRGQPFDLVSTNKFASFDFGNDLPSAQSVTALFGGVSTSAYALFCTTDGSVDNHNHTQCSFSPGVPAATQGAYVRVVNTSAIAYGICLASTAVQPDFIVVPHSATAFLALTPSNSQNFFFVPAGELCNGAGLNLTSVSIAQGNYYAVVLHADTTVGPAFADDSPPAAPSPGDADQVELTFGNEWASNGDDVSFSIASGGSLETIGPKSYQTTVTEQYDAFALGEIAGQTLTVTDHTTSQAYHFTMPTDVFNGGVYSLVVIDDLSEAGAPALSWCSDTLVTGAGATCVVITQAP